MIATEVNVEAATPNQDVAKSETRVVATLTYAFVATVLVIATIVRRWGMYDWLQKALSVALISNLLIFPLRLVFAKKAWPNVLRWAVTDNLGLAYLWVLMATLVYNRLG